LPVLRCRTGVVPGRFAPGSGVRPRFYRLRRHPHTGGDARTGKQRRDGRIEQFRGLTGRDRRGVFPGPRRRRGRRGQRTHPRRRRDRIELRSNDGEWKLWSWSGAIEEIAPRARFDTSTRNGTLEITHVEGNHIPADELYVRGEGLEATGSWEWTGRGGGHNIVAESGEFETDIYMEDGATFEHTFEESGTYLYYCAPHRPIGMKGAIVVDE